MQKLETALWYADLGYQIFPCAPGTKRPLTTRGFHDASNDLEQIEKWWTDHPDANIGLPTAGLIVVDVDKADNPWPGSEYGILNCPMQLTPRGGRHYIFRQPAGKSWGNTASKIAPNVDTRANGGYIVVAPSEIPEVGSYRWVQGLELECGPEQLPEPPPWLVSELDGARKPLAAEVDSQSNIIPLGVQDNTLTRIGGSMRRIGMCYDEIYAALMATATTRCVPPVAPKDVERIAKSVCRYEPDSIATAVTEDLYSQMTRTAPIDPGPFPEHLLDVPGIIGQFVDFSNRTSFRPRPALALGAAIGLVGAITGRKIRDDVNTRTNVYCIGVAESGGGKERPRQIAKEILHLCGVEPMIGEGIASHAGLTSAMETSPVKLFLTDEIGRMLKTMSSPGQSPHLYQVATVLLKLFSSANSIYVGDAYADAKKNRVINQPHCCLYATTVPKSLYESLTDESITDGFLARVMLFVDLTDVKKRRPEVMEIPTELVKACQEWLAFEPGGNLRRECPEPKPITMTFEAQEILEHLETEADECQRTLGSPLGTLWTRAGEKAAKLALIYACSRSFDAVIDADAMKWACSLSQYLTQQLAFLANSHIADGPFDARRKRVLRVISESGPSGISATDLLRRTKHLQKRERDDVIESLLECGDVRYVDESTTGRPTRRYAAI